MSGRCAVHARSPRRSTLPAITPLTISVVIPTLEEGRAIAGAVRAALDAGADEVVVADGGSRDGTVAAASAAGARVVRAPAGRGRQLAAGAQAAAGEVLWFVHADVRPRAAGAAAIRRALAQPGVVGGSFRIDFGPSLHGRFLAAFYHVLRRLGVYYGDSAVFCWREALVAVGGVPPHPIMEDLTLVRRLARLGAMAYLEEAAPVRASPRRWEQGGLARTWASWLVVQGLYWAHVPPARLATLYRHVR